MEAIIIKQNSILAVVLVFIFALSFSTIPAFAATNTSNSSSGTNYAAGSPQVNFTSTQITTASTKVKTFVDANHRLPNFVTINNYQVTMPQFLQLMAKNVININNGTKSPVPLIAVNNSFRATETIKSGNINKAEYLNMSKSINAIISCTRTAPSIMNTTLGNIKFETLVFTFSKILTYQSIYKTLPNTLSVTKWTYPTTTKTPITLRSVYITSDIISNSAIDNARINLIVSALKGLGVSAYNYGTPGKLWILLADKTVPKNALVVEIAGGADAGSIKEKGSAWYQGLLAGKKDFIVLTDNAKKITGLDWLVRAHDDNYSPPSFTGLAHPDLYLISHGVDYYEGYLNSKVNELAACLYNEVCT